MKNILGALFFVCTNIIFSSTTSSLTVFGPELDVFKREYGAGFYSLIAYYLSKSTVEVN